MNEQVQQIRAEIERRKIVYRSSENLQDAIRYDEITELLNFIDSLPEQPVEETPEPYTGVYDEAYLQEKIAKATKSWEGVDVDKMLAECRGYEQPVEGLEEEIKRYGKEEMPVVLESDLNDIARHFAEWGKKKEMERQERMVRNYMEGRES